MMRLSKTLVICILALLGSGASKAQSLQEALKLMDYQKYEAAKRMFNQLISAEPSNADYLYYLGEVYYNLGEEDSAVYYYKQTFNANASSLLGNVAKARLLIYESKFDEAKPYIQKALGLAGKNDKQVAEIAQSYIVFEDKNRQNPKAAIDVLTPYVEKNKKSTDLNLAMGNAYLAIPDASSALKYLRVAEDMNPNSPQIQYQVGRIFRRSNPDYALSYFEKAYQLDSAYPPVYIELAEASYQKRQFTKGKRYYEKYLQLVENDLNARKRYISFLYLTRDYEKAISEGNEVLKFGDAPVVYRLMGYSQTELKNFEEAKRLMDKYYSIQDTKKYITFDHEYYARIMSGMGKDSLAAKSYLKVIEMDSAKNFETYLDVARAYKKGDMYKQAEKYYDIYLARKPNTNVYYEAGQMYYEAKMHEKALQSFEKVKELSPTLWQGYIWSAYSKSSLDPSSEKGLAKEDFEKAIEIMTADPDSAKHKKHLVNSYYYLAYYSHYIKPDKSKAREYYNKVISLDPSHANAKKGLKDLDKPAPAPKK